MKKIKELNVENKVKRLGVREDIERLLQAFDQFIFPSHHEGLPVTLIEAQGAGLPCIISRNITKEVDIDRKSTRLNSSHVAISYAVFCLKKKKNKKKNQS